MRKIALSCCLAYIWCHCFVSRCSVSSRHLESGCVFRLPMSIIGIITTEYGVSFTLFHHGLGGVLMYDVRPESCLHFVVFDNRSTVVSRATISSIPRRSYIHPSTNPWIYPSQLRDKHYVYYMLKSLIHLCHLRSYIQSLRWISAYLSFYHMGINWLSFCQVVLHISIPHYYQRVIKPIKESYYWCNIAINY